jgi:hypothetical protein
MTLEEETQIKNWLLQRPTRAKQESDRQWQLHLLIVKEYFPLAHTLHNQIRRRRNKKRVPGSRASNPVLTDAKLPRLFSLPRPFVSRTS